MSLDSLIVTHPAFLRHSAPGHPETPGRLAAILESLREGIGPHRFPEREAKPAELEDLRRVHSAEMISRVSNADALATERQSLCWLDADTYVAPESYSIARLAAGAGLEAADAVMRGEFGRAFCAIRPPGHHATSRRSMGFCLLNNIAVTAAYLLEVYSLERILIADFDVHHGNGTQEVFYSTDRVLFISAHQSGTYPGSGNTVETGKGEGKGYTRNLPFPANTSPEHFVSTWDTCVREVFPAYRPQFVLISAGFDAHETDPLASLGLRDEDYYQISQSVVECAQQVGARGIISFLEGGYALPALVSSLQAHLKALFGVTEGA
jgi:acetoin utilization deacetylase AcuC-like enzyme